MAWSSRVSPGPILEITKLVLAEPDRAGTTRQHGGQTWHVGPVPTTHPDLDAPIKCGECGSTDLVTLASQSCSSMGGDFYEDIEIRCLDCATYTLWSYAEND